MPLLPPTGQNRRPTAQDGHPMLTSSELVNGLQPFCGLASGTVIGVAPARGTVIGVAPARYCTTTGWTNDLYLVMVRDERGGIGWSTAPMLGERPEVGRRW